MLRTYLNPFNLVTFAIGLALLVYGAVAYQLPDWDVPVSILMATATYITAPVVITTVLKTNWINSYTRLICCLYAGFVMWMSVDGIYFIYWLVVNPDALVLRWYQFPVSICLYLICGLLWYKPQEANQS